MTRVPEEEAQGRYQEVLAWRAEGLTYADIGQRLGVSKMRVREIAEQAQRWQQRQSLEALPISAAAKAALWRAGLRTAAEVVALSDSALLDLPGIGPGTVATLRAEMAAQEGDAGPAGSGDM